MWIGRGGLSEWKAIISTGMNRVHRDQGHGRSIGFAGQNRGINPPAKMALSVPDKHQFIESARNRPELHGDYRPVAGSSSTERSSSGYTSAAVFRSAASCSASSGVNEPVIGATPFNIGS